MLSNCDQHVTNRGKVGPTDLHKSELGIETLLLEYAARFGVVADQTEAYYSDLASRLRREVTYQGGLILVVASHKSELGR